MKRKLEQGGYDDGRVVMLQNFLTESQMDMARLVTNNHKFEDVTFEDVNRNRISCSSVVFPVKKAS